MDDEELADLVNSDLREQLSPEEAAVLRTPELRSAWFDELRRVKRSIETQLARRRTQLDFDIARLRTDHAGWRRGVLRLKHNVEDRIAEAHPDTDLRAAIMQHRESVLHCENDGDSEAADLLLWELIADDES